MLEGDEEQIDKPYLSMITDKRHKRVNCVHRKEIAQHDFPDWKMGFRNLSSMPLQHIEGFSDFMHADDSVNYLLKNTGFASTMLKHFKKKYQEIFP